eukprot:6172649-Pleurochrysis_carterae.AAC.1
MSTCQTAPEVLGLVLERASVGTCLPAWARAPCTVALAPVLWLACSVGVCYVLRCALSREL